MHVVSKIWISIIALLVATPILVVGLSWLLPQTHLWAHFAETVLPQLALSTAVLLVGVGLGVTLLGTVLAYLVVMVEFPGRRWLEMALFLPFAIPAYVLAFVYLGVFDYDGYVQIGLREVIGLRGFDIRAGRWAIISTFILVFYPYVYMMTRAAFKHQKVNVIEATKLLGANFWQVFWRVSLPLARPAAAAGLLVTLMETIADFGVASLFNYDTLTHAIYSAWSDFRSIEVAAQLASLLVLVAFLLIYFEKKARGAAKYYSTDVSNKRPYQATGWQAWLISGFVFAVFMLAFALPILQLLVWAWGSYAIEWSAHYWRLISSTAVLSTGAALLTVIIAFALAIPNQYKQHSRWIRTVIRLSTLGYALPGSVMAVGLLYGVAQLSALHVYLGGESFNHLIFGSIVLLLLAYVSRFIAIAHSVMEAVGEQIKPSFLQSALLLGASRTRLVRQVYLPMMMPGILAGALLVAVDAMKELPATYLLRPYGWDTLAIQVYELSAEGLFERAAIPALLMVVLGVLLMLVFRVLDKKFQLP